MNESTQAFVEDLQLSESSYNISALDAGESRYIKDARINLKNALNTEHLDEKEAVLVALAIAVNQKSHSLIKLFEAKAEALEIPKPAQAEAMACASLLSANNVLYRFRHFVEKEKYNELPARIKMNIMMKPVLGKEFFELVSLAVSAINGCEMCVKSHEESVLQLGASEERVFEAIRLASIIVSIDKLLS